MDTEFFIARAKRPKREVDHPPTLDGYVKNAWYSTSVFPNDAITWRTATSVTFVANIEYVW